ncbi:hypothetical protein QMT05_07580 [Cronobacter malonaticus]|uniref:hypothetical protein n=1 Tax=Cronobacter malonaticus TaxID=413503 RepID=UPI00051860C8|nr:hypothetical protein [Cronobacter malonaticus]EGT4370841.1 hypothetical protein [Cronobacter malonaticus]MDI6470035.1 hypothetical protein [Cronobacter malonaticus]MDK1174579.1 hypothetical protein [Cronobacter malonaticus]MDK1686839.1 hypothetical protein [Cronobacter malonaticus]HAU5447354.1 hypothetical protein [Cronobacter malonaticus]
MNNEISKGVWLVANIVIGKLITSIVSKFRKPELYLAIEYPMKDLTNKKKINTTVLYIINKGKNTEKNIVIHFPQNRFLKILSSEGIYPTIDNDAIKIGRLLKNEHSSITISYLGDVLSKENKPILHSENATGKTYLEKKNIPISRGPTFFGISSILILSMIFVISSYLNINPLIYSKEKINSYRYSNFFNSEFSTNLLTAEDDLSPYDIKNNEFPVKLISTEKINDAIAVKIEVLNKYETPVQAYISFDVKNAQEFNDKYEKLKDEYIVDNDYKKFVESGKKLLIEYNIPSTFSSEKINLAPGQKGALSLTRKIKNILNMNDMNMLIFLKTNNGETHLFKFDFSKSQFYKSNPSIFYINEKTNNQ